MASAVDDDCGVELDATKESSGDPKLNCGGAVMMASETVTVCESPAQGCDVQVTVTVPE